MKKIAIVCGYIGISIVLLILGLLALGIVLLPALILYTILMPSIDWWCIPLIVMWYIFLFFVIYGVMLISGGDR